MPELPEVEVVRRGLEPHIVGHVFNSVDVLHPRANRGQDAPLDAILRNHQISGIQRRGKYLWCELDGRDEREDDVLFMHLGMSGQLRIGHTDSKHVRIRAHLSGGVDLSFIDQRTFGYWLVAPLAKIDHIGPDPLSPGFDIVAAARKLRTKRTHVKTALLDQTIASGIGNIYADEALWRARVSPLRKANRLLQREAIAIYEAAAAVMTEALAQGGTSFDALYVNVNGESGYFSRSLHAYGRVDEPCDECGTPLNRIVLNARSSHYCPACQK